MITVNEIFSKVQNAIGDLAMEKFQAGEYVDAMNDVAMSVAEKTEIWINRYTTIPNPMASTWTATTTYAIGSIVLAPDGNYYTAIALSLNQQPPSALFWTLIPVWAAGTTYSLGQIVRNATPAFYSSIADNNTGNVLTDTGWWYPITNSNLISQVSLPETVAPYKLLQVFRRETGNTGWIVTREYSLQAIGTQSSGSYAFGINTTELGGESFATTFINAGNVVDGCLMLTFAGPFSPDEEVLIDYISNRPFISNPLTMWSPNISPAIEIPDFLRESFYYGLLWKVTESLYMRGDESFGNRSQLAKKQFDIILREAIGYARMLKDNRSSLQMQPVNWLPEE